MYFLRKKEEKKTTSSQSECKTSYNIQHTFFLLYFLKLFLPPSLNFFTFSHTQQVLYFIIQKKAKKP